jgi:hypothetical protein
MRWFTLPILCFVAAFAAGCGDNGSRPSKSPEYPPVPSLFYPLDIGNTWTYQSSFSLGFYDADSGAPIRTDTTRGTWNVELTGSERVGGVEYVVETTVVTSDSGEDTTWVRLRQDDEGLYRADISRRLRPGSGAIAGITDPPFERVRLRYPLETGAQWDLIPATNPVIATVEAPDTLLTPVGLLPAWWIRIDPPNRGPDDHHHVWHGRHGKIREEEHAEFTAIDDLTGERVRIVTDINLQLQSFDLVGTR